MKNARDMGKILQKSEKCKRARETTRIPCAQNEQNRQSAVARRASGQNG